MRREGIGQSSAQAVRRDVIAAAQDIQHGLALRVGRLAGERRQPAVLRHVNRARQRRDLPHEAVARVAVRGAGHETTRVVEQGTELDQANQGDEARQ